MGKIKTTGPPSNGNGPEPPQGNIEQIMSDILNFLISIFGDGGSKVEQGLFSLTTGGTFEQLWKGTSLKVRKCIIQNISTENVTIVTYSSGAVAGQGIILNKANAIGEGGGTLPLGNIDLSDIYVVRASSGATLSYIIERGY